MTEVKFTFVLGKGVIGNRPHAAEYYKTVVLVTFGRMNWQLVVYRIYTPHKLSAYNLWPMKSWHGAAAVVFNQPKIVYAQLVGGVFGVRCLV